MTIVFNQTTLLTGTDDGGGDGNITLRQTLAAALLSSAIGNKITVSVLAGTSNPASTQMFTNMFIGQAAAGATGAAPSFTGNQVRVTWSGVNTLTLGAAGTATSDAITLGENWDNTKNYIVAWDTPSVSSQHQSFATLTNGTLSFAALNAGVNSASVTTVSGFTANASVLQFISELIVTAALAPLVPSGRSDTTFVVQRPLWY
jgi:hypothetical protein